MISAFQTVFVRIMEFTIVTNGLIIKWVHSLASEYTISSIRQGYIESNLLVQTIIRPLVKVHAYRPPELLF